jgi:hypothetical protein
MEQLFKPPFLHFVKKQPKPLVLGIRDEVGKVVSNPILGEMKVGDLAEIRVHKFTFNRQQYLMAYCHEGDSITFYMVGSHENFYDELKRYRKAEK